MRAKGAEPLVRLPAAQELPTDRDTSPTGASRRALRRSAYVVEERTRRDAESAGDPNERTHGKVRARLVTLKVLQRHSHAFRRVLLGPSTQLPELGDAATNVRDDIVCPLASHGQNVAR
jgi:hypothetical protein